MHYRCIGKQFRTGECQTWGISYGTLVPEKPRQVVVPSLQLFGRQRPSFNSLMKASSDLVRVSPNLLAGVWWSVLEGLPFYTGSCVAPFSDPSRIAILGSTVVPVSVFFMTFWFAVTLAVGFVLAVPRGPFLAFTIGIG